MRGRKNKRDTENKREREDYRDREDKSWKGRRGSHQDTAQSDREYKRESNHQRVESVSITIRAATIDRSPTLTADVSINYQADFLDNRLLCGVTVITRLTSCLTTTSANLQGFITLLCGDCLFANKHPLLFPSFLVP